MCDYLIVGTGLFGSIFAYEAKKRNKKVLLIDKLNHAGGNVYCDLKDGINIHCYGAHIFHTNSRIVWDYITSKKFFDILFQRKVTSEI